MHEALFYEKLSNADVICSLCRHRCRIVPGKRGICNVRENRDGLLVTLVYGMLVAEHVDPVEKKPLYHFYPGTLTYSIATIGCNFRCRHCQNHSIAQQSPDMAGHASGRYVAPEEVVRRAIQAECTSISYTYTEPTIFFEYALDVARLAHSAGLKNIFVTNGYITPEALDAIAPFLDAVNIDLKGFEATFYQRVVGAHLEEVLECIKDYQRRGIWIEITTLVIPGENDSDDQLNGAAAFIASALGAHVPWHISRFFPTFRMADRVATPWDSLVRAVDAGKRNHLKYLYVGNHSEGYENTDCPVCGAAIITRQGHRVLANSIEKGACGMCGTQISGLW
jgi:pyruvate formate lyase activating enzyme